MSSKLIACCLIAISSTMVVSCESNDQNSDAHESSVVSINDSTNSRVAKVENEEDRLNSQKHVSAVEVTQRTVQGSDFSSFELSLDSIVKDLNKCGNYLGEAMHQFLKFSDSKFMDGAYSESYSYAAYHLPWVCRDAFWSIIIEDSVLFNNWIDIAQDELQIGPMEGEHDPRVDDAKSLITELPEKYMDISTKYFMTLFGDTYYLTNSLND